MDKAPGLARLEYHRSHLRFYAKHNPAPERLALRAVLAGHGGLGGWPSAGRVARGPREPGRRAEAGSEPATGPVRQAIFALPDPARSSCYGALVH